MVPGRVMRGGLLLLLGGCLERVTGVEIPLDERFYRGSGSEDAAGAGAAPSAGDGQPTGPDPAAAGAPGGDPGGGQPSQGQPTQGLPYADATGEKFTVSGEVTALIAGAVRIDVCEPDSAAPGGQRLIGTIQLAATGPFSLDVPVTVKELRLQAFQDPGNDGPGEADPYAEATLALSGAAPAPVSLALEAGARGRAAGGDPNASGAAPPGGPAGEMPYAGVTGDKVAVTGTVAVASAGAVRIDVCESDPGSPGGLKRVGAVQLSGAGPFSFDVPVTVKELWLQAFQDPGSDGPSESDPYAEARLVLDGTAPAPQLLTLEVGQRGRAGGPQPGGDAGAQAGGAAGTPPAAPGGEGLSFPAGPKVAISGRIEGAPPGKLMMDVFKADGAGGGARSFVGKVVLEGADFRIEVPAGYGSLEIEVYVDLGAAGRSAEDVVVIYDGNPLAVGKSDLDGLTIRFP